MNKIWGYAELSKAAKEAGGPEKYVEMLKSASKKEGKKEMLPFLGATVLLAIVTTKIVDHLKYRKNNNIEIEMAKEELIKGIKEYDESHEEGGVVMQMCPFCDNVYDESEYSHCPYCSGELDDDGDDGDDGEVRP